MFPVLFSIGPITLYSYGLFAAAGFFAALTCSKILAGKNNSDPQIIADVYFVILLSGIIGARLFYVMIYFDQFRSDWTGIFKIWTGGLVFYGGFITALAAVLLYLRHKKAPIWQTGDLIFPGIALGHAFGRVGCFFAGCCHGKVCTQEWAVQFTHPQSLAPLNIPLHPTQLYSVASNLFIFFILLFIGRYKSSKKYFHGIITVSYMIIYPVFRSIIEFFRGDFRGNFMDGWVSTSQGISLIVAAAGIILFFRLSRKKDDHN